MVEIIHHRIIPRDFQDWNSLKHHHRDESQEDLTHRKARTRGELYGAHLYCIPTTTTTLNHQEWGKQTIEMILSSAWCVDGFVLIVIMRRTIWQYVAVDKNRIDPDPSLACRPPLFFWRAMCQVQQQESHHGWTRTNHVSKRNARFNRTTNAFEFIHRRMWVGFGINSYLSINPCCATVHSNIELMNNNKFWCNLTTSTTRVHHELMYKCLYRKIH